MMGVATTTKSTRAVRLMMSPISSRMPAKGYLRDGRRLIAPSHRSTDVELRWGRAALDLDAKEQGVTGVAVGTESAAGLFYWHPDVGGEPGPSPTPYGYSSEIVVPPSLDGELPVSTVGSLTGLLSVAAAGAFALLWVLGERRDLARRARALARRVAVRFVRET